MVVTIITVRNASHDRENERSYQSRGYSRSRPPPSKGPSKPSGSSRPSFESAHQVASSHAPKFDDQRRRIETEAHVITEQTAMEPTGEGAIRIAKLKKDFPNIGFDGFHFPPNLKRIPNDKKTQCMIMFLTCTISIENGSKQQNRSRPCPLSEPTRLKN